MTAAAPLAYSTSVELNRPNAVFSGARSCDVIAAILRIHFPDAPMIADLTWGKGAFWSGDEWVLGLDIASRYGCHVRADSRHTPLRDGVVDLAVFDPPFLVNRGAGGVSPTTLRLLADYGGHTFRTQQEVRQLYIDTAPEIRRIARCGAIIKCADIVDVGFQPTHALLIAAFQPILGLPADIAILDSGVVRPIRFKRVLHLRNAHSYFLVYKWTTRRIRGA